MRVFAVLLLIILLITGACKQDHNVHIHPSKRPTPIVYVTNYPLYYFTNRIAGQTIDLHFPAYKHPDPSSYKPPTDTITAMQQADALIINGAGFEPWLIDTDLPEHLIADTSQNMTDKLLGNGTIFTHSHDNQTEHAHTETASILWLDLDMANQQALAITNTLKALLPKSATQFEANYNSLYKELMQLHQAIKSTTQNNQKPVIFSHPIYQYFQRAYKLKGANLHWEPTDSLTPEKLTELKHLNTKTQTNIIIWETTPNPQSVTTLQQLGFRSITINPCTATPTQGDFLSIMQRNLNGLQDALNQD